MIGWSFVSIVLMLLLCLRLPGENRFLDSVAAEEGSAEEGTKV